MNDLITMTEAAGRMGCSRVWVYQLIKSGRLKAQMVGGIYILRIKDVDSCEVRAREKPASNGHTKSLPQKQTRDKRSGPKTKAGKSAGSRRTR